MNQYMNTALSGHPTRMMTLLQHLLRGITRPSIGREKASLSELLLRIEESTTPEQLNRGVNQVQEQLWNMALQEQVPLRNNLLNALSRHVLCSPSMPVRIEAARWLRLLVQAGLVTRPADIFVTLVTAATRSTSAEAGAEVQERRIYLKLLFECFWPFRHPYPAYAWEDFPTNDIFYPLLTLFAQADARTQTILMAIFAELPALNDPEFVDTLLPVALQWAQHSDPEYRRIITGVLARMSHPQAQEALQRLLTDPEPAVYLSARHVSSYTQPA
jgi:hypothetical protein